jgi:arylsulfatase A-like enzyme
VIESQVTLTDLYDTFLEIAGLDCSDYALTTSLTDWSERQYHDYTFAEYAYPSRILNRIASNHPSFEPEDSGFDRSLRSVRDDEFKLILGSDGERSLYRWREDPYEESDLAADHPAEVERLESVVDEKLGILEKRAEAKEQVSAQVREQLDRLGYR